MKKVILLHLIFIFTSTFALALQTETITGTVRDKQTNEPLPGVSIKIVGTTSGTTTNIDGEYSLNTSASAELQFSFIGYVTQTIAVNGRSRLDVVLSEDIQQLSEVVVVGYGQIKKSDLTGSVTSIKSEELIKSPSADAVNALQGKVAGLQVLNNSGQPGAEANVRLRGINTINDNRVLYVVDGVIIEDGGIGFLNSNDIASVEVLKDASSKAIYGTRGSNGVIIVTTKKAGKGEGSISVSSEYGIENIANKIGLMSGPEFATLINEVNPGTYNNLEVLPNTDWQDQVFQDWQPIQTYNVSASGSSDKLTYYLSGGYYGQQGIIPNSDFDRVTVKLNTTYQVKKYLNIGANLSGISIGRTNPAGVVSPVYWAWPINSPYTETRAFAEVQGSGNPLASIAYNNSETNELRSVGNIYTEITFLDGFTFKTSYQFDVNNSKTRSFTPEYFVAPLQQNEESDINVGFSESRRWIFENTLSYDATLLGGTLNAVIGYSAQEDVTEFLGGARQNLIGVDPSLWYLSAGAEDLQTNQNGGSERALTSLLFRANYAYQSKYLMTVTFRRDGSTSFGENVRHGNFPAIALGWNISNESFYPEKFIINKLKLRSSYGINGNQRISSNDQFSRIGPGSGAVFGEAEALVPGATFTGQPGNPDLKWETTTEYDIGLEFHVFQSRLIGEVDYYSRKTSDILVNLDLPGYVGAGAFVQKRFNAADVTNNGLELSLNWKDDIGDFTYSVGINGFNNKNEVTNIGSDVVAGDRIISGDLGNGQQVTVTEPGMPIGYFYGYKVAGVFQNTEQLDQIPHLSQQGVGDFIYEDTNKDGVLNSEDKTFIGSWLADIVYGFNLSVGYKGLNISADFAGQEGNKIYNGKQAIRFATLNFEDKFLDRWTGEGTSNTDPKASLSGINYQPSDYFIEDASFFKLRTLTVNYDLPTAWLTKIAINSASVYVRGTNLFIWTDYTGYSPEIGSGNSALGGVIDLGIYPTTRVVSAGMRINF